MKKHSSVLSQVYQQEDKRRDTMNRSFQQYMVPYTEQDDIPDMIYFFSEPLVDQKDDGLNGKYLVETKFETLNTEAEYNELKQELRKTNKSFKILKEVINHETIRKL